MSVTNFFHLVLSNSYILFSNCSIISNCDANNLLCQERYMTLAPDDTEIETCLKRAISLGHRRIILQY